MTDQRRKGQRLIGEVTLKLQREGHLDPNEKDHYKYLKEVDNYIWNMSDEEFDDTVK